MLSRNLLLVSIAGVMLAGCGSLISSKGPDYRSQGGKIPSLEVPPDLTSPVADDRFVIPDVKSTTYSSYNRDRGAVPVATNSAVLPKVENARIERAGELRWLVVKTPADRVWSTTREFWTESGFVLKRELPEAGIMETDWAEDRSKIPQDIIRNTVGRLLEGAYDSGRRDKFRTRIEPGAEPGTTDIYISHRGVEEVYTSADKASTGWQTRPADRDLEAEMLARLMVKFGFTGGPEKASAAAAAPGMAAGAARAAFDRTKGAPLKVNEPFDRAWRRVGLALDRTGFTVEDRDRSKGMFFVRYIDPEADAKGGSDKSFLDRLAFWRKDEPTAKLEPVKPAQDRSFLDRLAFWRSDDPASKPLYRIHVAETAGVTEVNVQTSDGKIDNSATARRILGLLLDQLK
jgi:outer membrane protein assembly factor BamC